MCDIKYLKELLSHHIGPDDFYVGYIAKRLTAPGDNFGSLMLALEVKIRNKNGEIRTLNLVAKKIPETEFLQKIFNVQVSFRKELEIYESIIPILIDFQKEQDKKDLTDLFCKYYGGRVNANRNSNFVDQDAVILLENLKICDYKSFQRSYSGLNLEVAKFLLKDLAIFHAVPIALKLKDPKRFKDKILPVLSQFHIFINIEEKIKQINFERISDIMKEDEICAGYIDRVNKAYSNYSCDDIREPFATISHNDFWINNTMLKVFRGKPLCSKFLDFQTVDYGSPGKDVIFFLFSSIQSDLIEEYYHEFLKTYFKAFISTLKELECDTTPFTFDGFKKELELSAKHTQLLHLLFMYQPIYSEEQHVEELKGFSYIEGPSKVQKQKIWFIIHEFAKRNWI